MTGYHRLAVRLNRFPQGAPTSRQLYDILAILFTEEEARLVSMLPIRVFSARRAARVWNMDLARTRKILNRLCRKALLVDMPQNGEMAYCLPPPMAGFFEFSLMRKRRDIDQQTLAEHLYRYINMEEDFARALFAAGHTQLGRVFVSESEMPQGNGLQVLDCEKASSVIGSADTIGVSQCYCREKMRAVNLGCNAPKEICLTLNITAASLIRHGHARRVDTAEALDILDAAKSRHLVQFGENVREQVNFICNCCKCCCEGMIAARRFAMERPVATTAFIAVLDSDRCSRCGLCATLCPTDAFSVPPGRSAPITAFDAQRCLGCGVCARACPTRAIVLKPRPKRMLTPLNTAHRVVLMAIERNRLQHIIFDNQVLFSHRALATLLSVIFALPLAKRILAGRQLRSRYLESLISRLKWQPT
jgi:Pyruvate/2-oxoacid:ferredoxin oxidoreductase delta subunit